MKKKRLILFLVIVVIISVVGFLLSGLFRKEETKVDNRLVRYKGFDFQVPENVEFQEYDRYLFTLTSKNWRARVEIVHDKGHEFTQSADKYYELLKGIGYDVSKPKKINVSNKELIKYNRSGSLNSVIILGDYVGNFSYQIEFFNNKSKYSIKGLEDVLNILDTGVYRIEDHTIFYYREMGIILNYDESKSKEENQSRVYNPAKDVNATIENETIIDDKTEENNSIVDSNVTEENNSIINSNETNN